MPTNIQVRKYWADIFAKEGRFDLVQLSFDSGFELIDEKRACFACGQTDFGVERCHIKARCDGGSDDVSNIHMLCPICHKDSEFITGEKYFEWLYSRTRDDFIISMCIRSGVGINPSTLLKSSQNA
jgi:hypothetical protein